MLLKPRWSKVPCSTSSPDLAHSASPRKLLRGWPGQMPQQRSGAPLYDSIIFCCLAVGQQVRPQASLVQKARDGPSSPDLCTDPTALPATGTANG